MENIKEAQSKTELLLSDISNMSQQMQSGMEDIYGKVENLNSASKLTKDAMSEVGSGTTETANAVQTQMQQTEAIQQKVEMVSSVAERINQSMQQTLQVLESAGKDMDVLVSQVDHSVEKGDSVAGQLETLDKYIEEMHSIVELISGITSQTSLLALNASIEAARAGENGKGFAVVAEQIRELADQSRESTEHINQIVNGLIENSNISVETAKKVSEAFEKQDAKIKDTEAIFATLNSEINRVGSAVSGIAAEASDLEQHKNTIAYGVDNLAQFAEENASSGQITKENMNNLEQVMEQCKGSTDKIANVSAELVTQIKKFSGNGLKKR